MEVQEESLKLSLEGVDEKSSLTSLGDSVGFPYFQGNLPDCEPLHSEVVEDASVESVVLQCREEETRHHWKRSQNNNRKMRLLV
jgi:hypothetical protein